MRNSQKGDLQSTEVLEVQFYFCFTLHIDNRIKEGCYCVSENGTVHSMQEHVRLR